MNIKNKILIFFLSSLLIFLPFFVFQVSAQPNPKDIEIVTLGYSVLPSNIFIFNGGYSNNVDEKPFTTYFEYKKNSSNLDNDPDETIKIIRKNNIHESGNFYTNPELSNYSTYYFRAVGYFNDNPSKKFYGAVTSLETGRVLANITIPYTYNISDRTTTSYIPPAQPFCKPPQELVDDTCVNPSSTPPANPITPTNPASPNTPTTPTPTTPSPTTPTSPSTPNNKTPIFEALVQCGNKEGQEPCGFDDILKLINRLIEFAFKILVVPLAAIMFAFAGLKMIISGGASESARSEAKEVFMNTVTGLAIAAGSYLIIKTILLIIGYKFGDLSTFTWI
ncbi:MAG: pilin [Candidatus Paceibacterota bacterium]|jgi:hypothetical protein